MSLPMEDSTGAVPSLTTDRGACFGFGIRSAISFACLRDGGGLPLEIGTAAELQPSQPMPIVVEWREPPDHEPFARLYRDGTAYWLWVRRGGWTRIEPDVPRITLPETMAPGLSEEHVWTIPVSLCLLRRGDLVLHAAAVEIGGRAVLLVAAGGAGKSTLAAACVQSGFRLLSEDLTCVRMSDEPGVIAGPAMLRLRPDVLAHLALPGARVIRQVPSRVTFALDPAVRGSCDPVPLRAIFLLEAPSAESPGGTIPPAEGIRRLWSMAFRLPEDDAAYCFGQLAALARVPIRHFPRPRAFEELPGAVEALTR